MGTVNTAPDVGGGGTYSSLRGGGGGVQRKGRGGLQPARPFQREKMTVHLGEGAGLGGEADDMWGRGGEK